MTTTEPTPLTAEDVIDRAFQLAYSCQQAGQLQDAEHLYCSILKINPSHPNTHHNLGTLAIQSKQTAASLPHFKAALDADPTVAQYWLSYIDALIQTDQAGTARQMLALAKQRGLHNEGITTLASYLNSKGIELAEVSSLSKNKEPNLQEMNTLINLFNQGRFSEAEPLAKTMTTRYPQHGFGWKALGVILKHLNQHKEALPPIKMAAQLSPNDAEAQNNLGNALQELGQFDDAKRSFLRALEIDSGYAAAHNNLGNSLRALGQPDKAAASYRLATRIKPAYAEAHSNLGLALKELGQIDEAVASCRLALEIKPDYADAHNNLGSIFFATGQLINAEASFRKALELKPDYAEAYSNLGGALLGLGHTTEAVSCYRRAIAIDPAYAKAYSNLGTTLHDSSQMEEKESLFRKALELNPDFHSAHSNLLFCLSQRDNIDPQSLFAEHRNFSIKFEYPLSNYRHQHSHNQDPARCLQVGFVSGDLCNHAVANFIEPILAHLSLFPELSLHAYYNHSTEDAVTARIKKHVHHWHSIVFTSDIALTEKIYSDKIDILIDLSGHTDKNRLLVFARKPAPIQISWMGYPGTTGLKAIDYYFADRFFLPPGLFDDQFTEKIAHIPAGTAFLPYSNAPSVNTLPALNSDHVTFGSFNRPSKISRSVVALWAQLMRSMPDSKMLLGAMSQDNNSIMLIEWFEQEGIARERLLLHQRCGMETYLGLHQQVDICLDTFPYNGGTTTLHALWMGVPTLTLTGSTAPSRAGASILGQMGLEEFIVHNTENFVHKGLFWGGNLAMLSDIRAGLRERFTKSAMGQPALVAAGVERSLRIMWQRWCTELPTKSFEVSLQDIDDIPQKANT